LQDDLWSDPEQHVPPDDAEMGIYPWGPLFEDDTPPPPPEPESIELEGVIPGTHSPGYAPFDSVPPAPLPRRSGMPDATEARESERTPVAPRVSAQQRANARDAALMNATRSPRRPASRCMPSIIATLARSPWNRGCRTHHSPSRPSIRPLVKSLTTQGPLRQTRRRIPPGPLRPMRAAPAEMRCCLRQGRTPGIHRIRLSVPNGGNRGPPLHRTRLIDLNRLIAHRTTYLAPLPSRNGRPHPE
jgi:hypothetical protein